MTHIRRRDFVGMCSVGVVAGSVLNTGRTNAAQAREKSAEASDRKTFVSDREDGRFVDTAGFMQAYIKANRPKLAFDPGMQASELPGWREKLRAKVLELMAFPDVPEQPQPRRIRVEQRDGYQLQRWEAYPEPYCVVPFLMLVPDGVSDQSPAPAVMCFPGSSGSKESLAGEPELKGWKNKWDARKRRDNSFARHYVRQGMVSLAIDNPAKAEAQSPLRNVTEVANSAIWAGRSYLGISVFQKTQILKWLARQSFVDAKRIATCGLSLGSDPADIVGLLNPRLVSAVIHNDFCCDWRERSIAMSGDSSTAWHIVPGMYAWFDAPDIQAALAPRHLLFTEGGRTNQLDRIRAAYELQGSPDNLKIYYYEKYATSDQRPFDHLPIPEGLNDEEYFKYANVDVANHRFHPEVAVPWLAKVFGAVENR